MILGYFTGFLFDVLDDGIDDVGNGVVGGGATDLAIGVGGRQGDLEVVREKIVDGLDGGVDDLRP